MTCETIILNENQTQSLIEGINRAIHQEPVELHWEIERINCVRLFTHTVYFVACEGSSYDKDWVGILDLKFNILPNAVDSVEFSQENCE